MNDLVKLEQGVLSGGRTALGQAITLVESTKPGHLGPGLELLQNLLPHTGKALRMAITGPPGVGKSTLIETLGCNLTDTGHKVAVLAIDPSSVQTGGSILGDKTRMEKLSRQAGAFIRPSPSAGTLGGVAGKTREAMLLCEAAGFDVVIVETVGAGQSEVAAAGMSDIFIVLALPGAGDELQGIKKGMIELADIVCVNKADGAGKKSAGKAAAHYRAALNILRAQSPNWSVPVLEISGLENTGLDKIWDEIGRYQQAMKKSGEWEQKRQNQLTGWMWSSLETLMLEALRSNSEIRKNLADMEAQVREGSLMPPIAAGKLARLLKL